MFSLLIVKQIKLLFIFLIHVSEKNRRVISVTLGLVSNENTN